ncbi:hypothetical protein Tco_1295269 [Tanacetum coccineum]
MMLSSSKQAPNTEIDDFYEHEDSEATQDDEKDDEVNKAKTDDDDDDDGSQFSMEFRKKKESPIPTPPRSNGT